MPDYEPAVRRPPHLYAGRPGAVAALRRREIPMSDPASKRRSGIDDLVSEPGALEHAAFARNRPLLILSRPDEGLGFKWHHARRREPERVHQLALEGAGIAPGQGRFAGVA